jgi:hypothetical protein
MNQVYCFQNINLELKIVQNFHTQKHWYGLVTADNIVRMQWPYKYTKEIYSSLQSLIQKDAKWCCVGTPEANILFSASEQYIDAHPEGFSGNDKDRFAGTFAEWFVFAAGLEKTLYGFNLNTGNRPLNLERTMHQPRLFYPNKNKF